MTVEEYIATLNLADDAKKKATEALKTLLKDNYIEKVKFDAVNTAKSGLEKQLAERDKQLEDLKKTTGNKEEFETKIKTLEAENKKAKAEHEKQIADLKIDSAIKLGIVSTAQDADIVAGLIDKSKLVVQDDKIIGLDEQIKNLKTSKPFLFKTENGGKNPNYQPNGGTGGNKVNPFDKKTFNLTEAGKMFKENPEQAKTLAAQAGFNLGGIN